MIVAATYDNTNGEIFQHFGKTEWFKLYEIYDNRVVDSAVVSTNGNGHGALAGILQEYKVDVLICGGIGGGAKDALKGAGIKLYGGVMGNPDVAVAQLIKNSLKYNPNVECTSHEHEHDHSCGEHTCGSHTCGEHTCGNH